MFNVIKRATRASVLGVCLLALVAGPTSASGAEIIVGGDSLDGVAHVFNICGWEVTETAKGQIHWAVAIADDHHGHVTVQEVISTVLVIDDDPDVPESLRGATWRGHNMISPDRIHRHSHSRGGGAQYWSMGVTIQVPPAMKITRRTLGAPSRPPPDCHGRRY